MSMDQRRKQPCRFKGDCNKFRKGQKCDFSHDKCKFGTDCRNKATCFFYHDDVPPRDASSQRREPLGPRSEAMCRFGPRCNKLAQGLCTFKHDPADRNQTNNQPPAFQPRLDRSNTLCKFGDDCHQFKMGKCLWKHDQPNSFASNSPQTHVEVSAQNQGILALFDELCLNFISDQSEIGECNKVHEYSTQKTIKKIFVIGQNSPVLKVAIFEGYNNDEQPLYIMQERKRIIFGQLVNLAKQIGCENVPVQTLIMKRWYHKDLIINSQAISGMFSLNTITTAIPRLDLLLITTNSELHVFFINRQKLVSMPMHNSIKSVAIIGCQIIILFTNYSTAAFTINYPSLQLTANKNFKVSHRLASIKSYSKLLYGSELIIGICDSKEEAKGIYLINQSLQCKFVQIDHIFKDFTICEYSNLPICLLLTNQNKIVSLNILTYQTSIAMNAEVKNGAEISSILVVNNHFILAIKGWGVLVYTLGNFATPIGALAMGPYDWNMAADSRGNFALISDCSLSIFKIRKN